METPNRRITRSKTASPGRETIPESNTSSHQRITFSTPTKDVKTKETTKIKACKIDSIKKLKKNLKQKTYIPQIFRTIQNFNAFEGVWFAANSVNSLDKHSMRTQTIVS
ncbi:hypothetical protein Fot_29326 [Forsythia ovata]|uniref:Uncharacterized protein n=1 Tax=Forsythia ovata TaxID=205694 RepID=A0ABD1TRK5_9LAMI